MVINKILIWSGLNEYVITVKNKQSLKSFSHKCKCYSSISFSEVALNTISKETGKLSLYKTVKVVYRYEMYLDITNSRCRKATTKLRISDHHFP